MGETMETNNTAFWLPTHFLTDDDLLSGADHHPRKEPARNFDLFSNGFDPFGSPVSSTETETDNDDDELLAELTRQLAHSTLQETHNLTENPWLFSTSPQSTLTGFGPWTNRSGFSSNGSPNGPSQVPSPPLTPPGDKNDAAWELLYEAAGQVARLKMNAIAAQLSQHHHQHHNRGLLVAPHNPSLSSKSHHHHTHGFYDNPNTNQLQQLKRQEREEWYCQHYQQRRSCGGALGLPPSAWPPLRAGPPQPKPHLHNHHRQQGGTQGASAMRAVFLGGSGLVSGTGSTVKRQSTGTGVFIPRRFGAESEPRKKPAGCSTVLLPERVVQALNLNPLEINNGVNLNSQSRIGSRFVTDHEILLARRNALLSQQRKSSRPEGAATMVGHGHDIRLPSDWTY